jgi:hypothetical protein
MNINQKREVILETLWSEYDFGDEVVKDVNGWERTSVDDYNRVVFLEKGDESSTRAVFHVKFKKGTVEVESHGF